MDDNLRKLHQNSVSPIIFSESGVSSSLPFAYDYMSQDNYNNNNNTQTNNRKIYYTSSKTIISSSKTKIEKSSINVDRTNCFPLMMDASSRAYEYSENTFSNENNEFYSNIDSCKSGEKKEKAKVEKRNINLFHINELTTESIFCDDDNSCKSNSLDYVSWDMIKTTDGIPEVPTRRSLQSNSSKEPFKITQYAEHTSTCCLLI